MIKPLLRYFDSINPILLVGGCFIYSVAICYLNYITGDYSLAIHYILSTIILSWYVGLRSGIIISIFNGIAMWFVTWLQHGNSLLLYWNDAIMISIMLLICFLIYNLRLKYNNEQEWARYDNLTGLHNRRYFLELAEQETSRAHRYHHSLTLLYIDLDNLKELNDSQGRQEGDKVLSVVGRLLKKKLRSTDIVGRLGGDKFAVIFLESNYIDAHETLKRIHNELTREMKNNDWSVTTSIGAVTSLSVMPGFDKLSAQADSLMYEAKKHGKGSLNHQTL